MFSLIGTILGLVTSAFPALIKLFQARQDQKHELAVMQLQMQAQAQGHQERLEEINANADISESEALYKASATTQIAPVGNKVADLVIGIVNALVVLYNSSVRPTVTYAFFACYALIKIKALTFVLPLIVEITVAETKLSTQIARDIRTRVLPQYLTTLDKIVERNAQSFAEHLRKVEALNALAAALNTEYQWEGYGQHRNYGQHSYQVWRADPIDGVRVRGIEAMYDGTIRLQLEDMTLETALKVIQTLKGGTHEEG